MICSLNGKVHASLLSVKAATKIAHETLSQVSMALQQQQHEIDVLKKCADEKGVKVEAACLFIHPKHLLACCNS